MFDKKRTLKTNSFLFAAIAGLALTPFSAHAQASADELKALREQIAALEARLQELETSAEKAQAPAQPASNPSAVTTTVDSRGFTAQTADKKYSFRIRPRLQIDFRGFLDDVGRDEVTVRRLRPLFQGTAPRLSWRFMPELAGDVRILDASVDLTITEDITLRAGKFKGVNGLERLQSFSQGLFMERGLPSNLTPIREIGFELQGAVLDKTLGWALGFYNGTLDDTDLSVNQDLSFGEFDFGARLFWEPFKNDDDSPLKGLGVGIGASTGTETLAINDGDRDKRIRYRTSARTTFFRYKDGVQIDGDRHRINPHLYYYNGPFGFLTEYLTSSYEIVHEGARREIESRGFTIQTGWVLTGEKASFNGVRPAKPFDPANGSWGAFEVGARYGKLTIDEDAFTWGSTSLAHSSAAQKAESITLGLNWYLTSNLLWQLNYEQTDFSGLGANRPTEKVILGRLQIDF